jgi:hypothetical protein
LAPYIYCSIVFTVVDAQDAGEGNGLKAHNGGCKAKVGRDEYKNVHFDTNWVAFAVKGDPEVLPEGILNADGSLKGKMSADWTSFEVDPSAGYAGRVFVVNKQNTAACNRFYSVKRGDLILNGYTSVMSVTTDIDKAKEYADAGKKHGTIWEIVTNKTGGKDIDSLSVIPPSHSDKVCRFCGLSFMLQIQSFFFRKRWSSLAPRCECSKYSAARMHPIRSARRIKTARLLAVAITLGATSSSESFPCLPKCSTLCTCVSLTLLLPRVEMLVNINNANQLDLMRLPQVGPARSFRILHGRLQGGGFQNRADFGERVIGFGTDTHWLPLSQYVTFGPCDPKILPRGETPSEQYDRIMRNRQHCEYLARIPAGPDHPWGPHWKP